MQYGNIRGIGLPVSRLAMGTIMVNTKDLEQYFALLDGVFELGCNTFDTGHVYGGGECERGVGRWINERGIRDRVVLLGKGAHPNADRKRVTPFDIASDLYDSLARFQTDYIDLYMLHRDDPAVPVGPIVEALDEHRRAGRIRAFGGSNWTHERIIEANQYAETHGLEPFVASSPHFSLAVQYVSPWGPDCVTLTGDENAAARQWYQETGTPVFGWSSLGYGFLSGRMTRDNYRDVLPEAAIVGYGHEPNFVRLDRAGELAAEKGLTIPQIGIAYLVSQPLNVFPLVGAYNPEEMKANIEACGVTLSDGELAWLNLEADSR